ncbi:MAG: outer membrane protein assembly factor BamE [Clostridiaceae bacterium]|nr:outer membrane protein assembly factor BamE [Clostridiaceae bacterium]
MGKLSERIKNLINFKKPAVWIAAVSVIFVADLVIGFMLYRLTAGGSTGFRFRKFTGHITELTLDDVRALAQKGDALKFKDFKKFKGADLSSDMSYHILLYKVEGNYRLIVRTDGKKIDSTSLERMEGSGGSGIDIRYSDVDEFIESHPTPDGPVIWENTLKSWRDIEVGMPREEVHRIMGKPDGMLSGPYGDIYKLDDGSFVIIYYDSESRVNHIKP